nr:RNA-binding protein 24 isoform X2 [Ipomoea batatas]GMD40301.1 RNA-binding protein 24 isoform X2 [Ipomoea batatas]
MLETIATSKLCLMATNKALYILLMGTQHMAEIIFILRAFTMLMEVSSTFRFMYLELLTHPCSLTTSSARLFPEVKVIHRYMVMQCLATRLCSLVHPMSVQ